MPRTIPPIFSVMVSGSGSCAVLPTASTAAISSAADAVPVTCASLVSSTTLADSTPSTAASAFSTLPQQPLHIMPPIRSVIVAAFSGAAWDKGSSISELGPASSSAAGAPLAPNGP